jgi:hypothetical protein
VLFSLCWSFLSQCCFFGCRSLIRFGRSFGLSLRLNSGLRLGYGLRFNCGLRLDYGFGLGCSFNFGGFDLSRSGFLLGGYRSSFDDGRRLLHGLRRGP